MIDPDAGRRPELFPLLDPVSALRHLEARDLIDVPETALADGSLVRLATSATTAEPTNVGAWLSLAHFASVAALHSVLRVRGLAHREVFEAHLADVVVHAAVALRDRWPSWRERHGVEDLLRDLRHVHVARGADGRPSGWGLVGEPLHRARHLG